MTSSALRIAVSSPYVAAPHTPVEQRIRRLVDLRAGEAKSAALFFAYAFILLVCYYQLRLLREPLILAEGSAELRSYAQAAMAAVLMVLVPVYAAAYRRGTPLGLVRSITLFFVANLAVFYLLGTAGFDIGFAYYVWVGVFGATMIAQFWAHAAHSFDIASGQRLFPLVMAGATLGGLAGAAVAKPLFALLGTWNLLLLATALLAATAPLVAATSRAVPQASRNKRPDETGASLAAVRNGFGLVLRDRYLLALAGLIVLLNCVSTTGDYLLAEVVLHNADLARAADPTLEKGALIGGFYGDFYFLVNALTVVLQLLLIGRVFRWLGVSGAVLVLPIVALLGYGFLAAVPIFGLIQLVKVLENGANYSVMNTARHALYLPLSAAQQYQGKTTIDGFFCRAGDLAQAGIVFVGLNWLGFGLREFAALNAVLAVAWIGLALHLARQYRRRAAAEPRAPRPLRAGRLAVAGLGLAVATAAPTAAADVGVREPGLFDTQAPLELELHFDKKDLCRKPERDGCEDARATLLYRDAAGTEMPIDVTLRSRGRWRNETGNCALPPLFVSFDAQTAAGTPFKNQTMLPLTTHCRDRATYEQYVLKEYLAYRIYNALTDKSLRVRLARITYRNAADSKHATTRFAFFTEHFDSLAARHHAEVWRVERLDVSHVEPQELARLALFQYMIGNTDWSILRGHNTVALRAPAGNASVVPYDFDFSGLVDAEYAGPPPELPISSVRQRLFRGFCAPAPDWNSLFADFSSRRAAIEALVTDIPELLPAQRERAFDYIESFFDLLDSPERRFADVVAACRSGS